MHLLELNVRGGKKIDSLTRIDWSFDWTGNRSAVGQKRVSVTPAACLGLSRSGSMGGSMASKGGTKAGKGTKMDDTYSSMDALSGDCSGFGSDATTFIAFGFMAERAHRSHGP